MSKQTVPGLSSHGPASCQACLARMVGCCKSGQRPPQNRHRLQRLPRRAQRQNAAVLLAFSASFPCDKSHGTRRKTKTAAAAARPETPAGAGPVVQLTGAVLHPPRAQSADVPCVTTEVCLLFLRVDFCHPAWERRARLFIYSLVIPNSASAALVDTFGYRLRGLCARLGSVGF